MALVCFYHFSPKAGIVCMGVGLSNEVSIINTILIWIFSHVIIILWQDCT